MNLYESIKSNLTESKDAVGDFKLDINPVSYNDIWLSFTGDGVEGSAKVFIEGSDFGIPRFRKISKLSYSTKDDECNYDRGWDVKPKNKELFSKICKALEAYRDAHPYDVNESELVEMDTWVDPRSKVKGWKVKVLDVFPDDYAGSTVAKVELFDPEGNSQGEDTIYIHRQKVRIGDIYDAYIDGIMAMPRIIGVEDFTTDEVPDMKKVSKDMYEAEDSSTKIIQEVIKSKNLPNGTKVSSITDDTFNSIVKDVQSKIPNSKEEEVRNKVAGTLYGMFEESDSGLKATILDTAETGGGNLNFVGELGDYNFVGGDGMVEYFDKSWGIDSWDKYEAIEDEAYAEYTSETPLEHYKYGKDIGGTYDFECKYAKFFPEYNSAIASALREYAKTVKNPNYARVYNNMADEFDSSINESDEKKVKVSLYGDVKEYPTIEDAIKDMKIAMSMCDSNSSEFKRYLDVYYQLKSGKTFCTDNFNEADGKKVPKHIKEYRIIDTGDNNKVLKVFSSNDASKGYAEMNKMGEELKKQGKEDKLLYKWFYVKNPEYKEAEEAQDDTEKYWDATTIQQDQFLRLMKFNFDEPHGCQYIITNDANEIERFSANSDEEALEQYNLFKEGLDSGLIELIPQDLNVKPIVPRD